MKRTGVSILPQPCVLENTPEVGIPLPCQEVLPQYSSQVKIFGKLTDVVLGIKCLHLLQIGPRCFASVMWMAMAAAEKHQPRASHSAALCSQPS